MRAFFVLFWATFLVQSQTVQLKGKVIDAITKQPVIYTNISFLKGNLGVSSQEDGTFILDVPKEKLQEKVHISCLNYKDTVVLANQILEKEINLKSKVYQLDEVVLGKKVNRELEVDKYKRRHIKSSFGGNRNSPSIVTKFFRYKKEYEATPYLKNIDVYFHSLLFRKKAKFRLRIFKKDIKTGNPSEDIVKKQIIVSVKKRNGKVRIDVSPYDIEFPKEGFFIGLERIHMPYNFYEYTYTMEGSKKKRIAKAVAPSFGAVYTKDTIKIFSNGKWRKFSYPKEFYKGNSIQPAISVTLTN